MEDLAVDLLATHRLVQLVTQDRIADRPRQYVRRLLKESGYREAADAIECAWCTGIWLGFGVAAVRLTMPRVWRPIGRALACADVAGIIATLVAPI